jgi:hypothetical protein
LPLRGVDLRRFQKRTGLAITQGRRFAFVRVGFRAFDSAHRVVSDRIGFAQMIKERSDRGELATDGARSQTAAFEVFAPSDQVGAGDLAHFFGLFHAGKGRELSYIDPISAPGARVIEVGEPLELRRYIPQPLELGAAQATFTETSGRNKKC